MADAIEELEAILSEVDGEIRHHQERLQILQQEKLGFQAALRRLRERKINETKHAHGGRLVPVPALQNPKVQQFIAGVIKSVEAVNAGRAEQIQVILDQAGTELTLAEIEELANRTGEHWTADQIRNAVASLHKKSQVRNVRRGVWISARTSADPVGAGSAESVPTTRPEGGNQGVEPPAPVLPSDHSPSGQREAVDPDRETGERDVVVQT